MEKIWILNSKRAKKYTIVYKSENALLKAINPDSDQEVLEYELKSTFKACDLFKEKDRDTQLRTILGELSTFEESMSEFIKFYNEFAIWKTSSEKKQMIKSLKKHQSDKKEISKIIVNNKRHFIRDVSTSVEWYKILLKVHNFRDYLIYEKKWDPTQRIYTSIDTTPEEVKDNFAKAKKWKK